MKNDDIRTRLNKVFRETFDDDSIEIFDAMTADDLKGWDSVSNISLMLAVEKEFNVRLNASQIATIENVGGLIVYLGRRLVDRI